MRVRTSVGALLCVVGLLAACVPPDSPSTLTVATANLEPGVAGVPFRGVLEASGGTEPYTWSATGLPDGFEIDSLGLISGDPTTTGTHVISATVRDAKGATATRQLILNVPDSLPAGCVETSCEDVELAAGVVEVDSSQIVEVQTSLDGAVVAIVVSGSVPSVGQVVVFGATAALPSGYIAEVTASSSVTGGATRLEVVPSTITDAYSEATIKSVREVQGASALQSAAALVVPSFSCSGGVTVDTGSTTAMASLSPSGVIQKNRPIFGSVEYIQVGVEGSITVSLDVGISGAATCTASLELPPAVIGPVDLKLNPTLTLEVSGAAQLSTSVTLKCGVYTTWYPSKGASTSRWCHPSGQPLEFTAGAKASLTADLKPTVSLKGLIGLRGSVAPKVTAEYTPPDAKISANWSSTLDLCVLCLLGEPWLELRVLSYTSPTKVLWQSNSGPSTTTTTTTVPPDDDLNFIHMAPPERYAAGAWAASDGSWLIVERDRADGTSLTYQRVSENGQIVASWTSRLRPGSVVAGANGEMYVLGFVDDASTPLEQRKRIVRIGEDGPVAHRALTLTNRSGNNTLAFGEDGNLYFLGHQEGEDWVTRLDPTSLVEERRLRVQAPVFLDYAALPTPTGLMTLFWGHIPYSAFDSLPNESDWATYTAREIQQGRFSLGTDRSAVFASDGAYCNATEIARRDPSGQVWRRTVPQLVPNLPSPNYECYVRDVDAMPDGRVVITAELPAVRTVVQYWVASDGSSSEAVAVGSAPEGRYVDRTSTAVDRNGTAVTKFVRLHGNCSWDCQQHVVSGARDAEHQFIVDLPASPEGVAYWSASFGFLGTPELAIGVGQVLVPLAECSTRRCDGGLTMFISTPADVEPSARPSFTHW